MEKELTLLRDLVSTIDTTKSAEIVRYYIEQNAMQSWAIIIVGSIFALSLSAALVIWIYREVRDFRCY